MCLWAGTSFWVPINLIQFFLFLYQPKSLRVRRYGWKIEQNHRLKFYNYAKKCSATGSRKFEVVRKLLTRRQLQLIVVYRFSGSGVIAQMTVATLWWANGSECHECLLYDPVVINCFTICFTQVSYLHEEVDLINV